MNYKESTHPNWDFESDRYYFGWLGKFQEILSQRDTVLIHLESGQSYEGFSAIPLAITWSGWHIADETSMTVDVECIRRLLGVDSYKSVFEFVTLWESCDFRDCSVIYRVEDGKVRTQIVDKFELHTDGWSIGVRK